MATPNGTPGIRNDPSDGPDPNYTGSLPANQMVNTFKEHKRFKCEAAFDKSLPWFNDQTTSWSDHMRSVMTSLTKNPVSDRYAKLSLFQKMEPATFAVVSEDFAPFEGEMDTMNLKQYSELLGSVFQPATESKALKISFQEYKQSPNEHYESYCRKKHHLWKRAYANSARDYDDLFTSLTNGLDNKLARAEMRKYRKSDPPQVAHYIRELGHVQNELREKYMAGELSFPDLKGMESREAYRTMYALQNGQHTKVKSEPIHHLTEEVNALNFKPKGKCFECQQYGHYRVNCPRATTGLTTAKVNNVDPEEDEINAMHHRNFKGRNNYPQRNQNRFQKESSFKPVRRVIAHLVEDENGQVHTLDVNSDSEPSVPVDEDNDEIHFLA